MKSSHAITLSVISALLLVTGMLIGAAGVSTTNHTTKLGVCEHILANCIENEVIAIISAVAGDHQLLDAAEFVHADLYQMTGKKGVPLLVTRTINSDDVSESLSDTAFGQLQVVRWLTEEAREKLVTARVIEQTGRAIEESELGFLDSGRDCAFSEKTSSESPVQVETDQRLRTFQKVITSYWCMDAGLF